METKSLYKKTKTGKLQKWSIWTEQEEIVISYGQVNGKKQTSRKACKGKNLGKSNATSPEEQAIKEALALIEKQRDKGYFDSEAEAKMIVVVRPMLAHPFEDKKHKVSYPCTVQPKLDGVRCLAEFKDGNVTLRSRAGKLLKNLQHIEKELKQLEIGDNVILDGEIYVHDVQLQCINSLIKRYQPGESEKLEYHLYDCFDPLRPDQNWHQRKNILQSYQKDLRSIKFVNNLVALSEDMVGELHSHFLKEGFEGAIVRNTNGEYQINQRSSDLLKVKSFQDEEFKVVGHTNGIGKFSDSVIWKCITPEGKTFDVVPKGTMEEKAKFLRDAKNYYGRKLTVKFFDKTKDNIPRFPVGLQFRESYDL